MIHTRVRDGKVRYGRLLEVEGRRGREAGGGRWAVNLVGVFTRVKTGRKVRTVQNL